MPGRSSWRISDSPPLGLRKHCHCARWAIAQGSPALALSGSTMPHSGASSRHASASLRGARVAQAQHVGGEEACGAVEEAAAAAADAAAARPLRGRVPDARRRTRGGAPSTTAQRPSRGHSSTAAPASGTDARPRPRPHGHQRERRRPAARRRPKTSAAALSTMRSSTRVARLGVGAEQRAVGQQVDAPRHAARTLVDALHAPCASNGNAPARPATPRRWRRYLHGLGFGQRVEVVARDHALRQLLELGPREHRAQLGLADQDDLQQLALVGLQVGQQAQLLEHVGRQVLRLVDDQHVVLADARACCSRKRSAGRGSP